MVGITDIIAIDDQVISVSTAMNGRSSSAAGDGIIFNVGKGWPGNIAKVDPVPVSTIDDIVIDVQVVGSPELHRADGIGQGVIADDRAAAIHTDGAIIRGCNISKDVMINRCRSGRSRVDLDMTLSSVKCCYPRQHLDRY
jgi:ribosomal protein L14